METYMDLTVVTRPDDCYFILNKVYRVVHGQITRAFKGKVGIGFPNWVDSALDENGNIETRGKIGDVLRLFGDEEILQHFRRNPSLDHFAEVRALEIGPIQEIPAVLRWIRFIRDRRQEKRKPGFLIRQQRRNERRKGKHSSPLEHKEREPIAENCHFLTLVSNSTQQRYSLFIRREISQANPGVFSSYGLSVNQSTIPDW